MKAVLHVILGCAGAFIFSGAIRADSLAGCASCQGSTYLLEYNPTPVALPGLPAGLQVWDVFFTIDATGYDGAPPAQQVYIRNVAIKISNSVDGAHSSLRDAPGGVPGTWSLQPGGLNANGCSGSGSGFLCAKDTTTAPVHPLPPALPVYAWEFYYATYDPLLTGTGENAPSIKAEYVTASGRKVGDLVSEQIKLQRVPDGGMTLMLLGSSLFGIEALRRRFAA